LGGLVLLALVACKNDEAPSANLSGLQAPVVGAAGARSEPCRPCTEELTRKAEARGVEAVDFSKVILIKPVGSDTCLLDYSVEDAPRGGGRRASVSFVSVPCSCECRDFPIEDDNEDATDIDVLDDEETSKH
jgi:hypothetical protein